MKELVLPSGRFATIRPITWLDRALCEQKNGALMVLQVATRVVTIDGEKLTLEQAIAMEVAEANPIIEAIVRELVTGAQSKGVA